MIARSVLAALVAGILAGLLVAVIHQVRLSPLIAAAEVYEQQTAGSETAHSHAAGTPENHSHDDGWQPTEGFQRIALTTVSWALTGAAFGLLLAAVSLLAAIPITLRNAFVWGACGFLAASIAPAAGIAPALPGMPETDLTARQLWWVFTVAATGLGMVLVVKKWSWAMLAVALFMVALPHVIGAPQPVSNESAVPAVLAANYVGATLFVSAVFWIALGFALARMMPQLQQEAGA